MGRDLPAIHKPTPATAPCLGQNFRKASPPAIKHRGEGVPRIPGCHGKSTLDFVALKSPSGHSTFIAIAYT